jgi:uncharacterized phiE125 gp8 family phage protein
VNITTVTAPVADPIDLAQAKKQLNVTFDDDDMYIQDLVKVAVELCEGYQGRAFIKRTLRRTLDGFPSAGVGIVLPYPPLISVVSIKYDDEEGTEQTLATDQYQYDVSQQPARITLAPNVGLWPATESQAVGSVRVEYEAGYGNDGDAVPWAARQAIRIKLADLYENRESIAPGGLTELGSVAAEALLGPDRIPWQGDNSA